MKLDRYDHLHPDTPKIATAINKAKLLVETLQRVKLGDVLARHVLLDMARDEPYEGPVIRFRTDDLFYEKAD